MCYANKSICGLLIALAGVIPATAQQTNRGHGGNAGVVTIVESHDGTTRTETRTYDSFDRVKSVTNPLNRDVGYGYDGVGNRTTLTDHDDAQTTWSYDELNRNTAITVPGQGTTTQTHTKAGKLDTITRPDGSTTTHTYDDAGRVATIVHAKGGQVIATFAYRYDLNGNRIEQRETNGATTNDAEVLTKYRYDDADRLIQVIEPGRTTDYELDAVGNRTKETVTAKGTVISRSILRYNARDQLISRDDDVANVHVTQTYDDNGNLITQTNNGVIRTYTYDARDRMLSLTEGTNAPLTFDYDANGMRLEKTQGGQSTKYQYDLGSLMAETNAIGNTLTRYHYSATQLLSETKVGTTPTQRYYLLDALRSVIALLTQQGAVSARTRYDAWGEVIAQQDTSGQVTTPARDGAKANLPEGDEQPLGFTGYLKDSESGLYYAKARYYDPAVARFTTEDPEAGKDMEPPSLHRYLYAYANPTAYVDTTGRVGYLTEWRDAFDSTDESLRDYAESSGIFGGIASGLGRAAAGLLSTPIRGLNFASDAVAQAIPWKGFEGVASQGSIELGKTIDPTVGAINHPVDTAVALHGAAVNTTSRVMSGEPGAISDFVSFTGQAVVGAVVAKRFGAGRSVRTVEGASGEPALRYDYNDLSNELEYGFDRGGHEGHRATLASTDRSGGAADRSPWQMINREDQEVLVQSGPETCGPACAAYMAQQMGYRNVSEVGLVAKVGQGTTNASKIADSLNEATGHGFEGGSMPFDPRDLTDSQIQSVVTALSRGGQRPFMALFNPPGVSAKNGHWIVVNGLDSTGNVQILDPAGFGYYQTPEGFKRAWRFGDVVK